MTTLILYLLLAQNFDWKSLDRFASRASNTVDVDLSGPLLRLAAAFLSDENADEARVRKLVAGLNGVHVKSFDFSRDGEFSESDLDGVRAQWKSHGWSRIIGVSSKSDGDVTEVYLRSGGIAVLCAGRREFTVIEIRGTVKLEDLRDLSGNFGIPKLDLEKKK